VKKDKEGKQEHRNGGHIPTRQWSQEPNRPERQKYEPTGRESPKKQRKTEKSGEQKEGPAPTDLDLPHGSSLAVLEADPDRRIGTPQMGSHLGHGVMFQIAPPQAEFGTISNIRYSLALI
jgi:hypothetical protein